jgi:nicotinamidase-related amidase
MKLSVELEIPDAKAVTLDPGRTAVVVIDLENEFCSPKGKRYLGPAAVEAVQSSAELIARTRSHNGRVIWVQSVRDAQAGEFVFFGREPILLENTWAVEYTLPLKVLDGEPVIQKRSHDCFNHTELDAYLESQKIVPPDWTIVVVGVGLSVCVDHAVLGFSVRDYCVVVPLDCVALRQGAAAAATLSKYGHNAYSYNIVVSTSALIDFKKTATRTGAAA